MQELLTRLYNALVALSASLKKPNIIDVIPLETKPPMKKSLLLTFCDGIVEYENMKEYHASNLNPGAFRFSSYISSLGAIGERDGYAVFKTYDDGYNALKQFVLDASQNKLKAYKNCSISTFFNSYAPTSDNNNPNKYALFMAKKCGVMISSKLSDII